MIFFWFIIPFLFLMVLLGTGHQSEEENEDEGGFKDEGEFEEDEGSNEEDNEGGKASLTPLWKFVTKLDVGRGGGTGVARSGSVLGSWSVGSVIFQKSSEAKRPGSVCYIYIYIYIYI
jgi:hypothetical protein